MPARDVACSSFLLTGGAIKVLAGEVFGCLGLLSGHSLLSPMSHMPMALSPPHPFPPPFLQVFFAFSDGAVFAACPILPANV